MTDCPRFGKWISGCRFEARFDWVPLPGEISTKGLHVSGSRGARMIQALNSHQVYVHDICTRCGKIAQRPQQQSKG